VENISVILGQRIQRLRTANGLNQDALAKAIGISRPAVTMMEQGKRKASASELVKIARFFNLSMEELVDDTKMPQVLLQKNKEVKTQVNQIRISVPQKNLDKFRQVLLYILNKVGSKPNIGETVIYKLLYFIDFNFYEKYEEQLIGATYIKNKYGPTPVEYRKIVEDMIKRGEIEAVKSSYFQYPQTKYLPRKPFDLRMFKAHEIDTINSVLDRLSDMSAKDISDYSHKDVPWLTADDGKPIDYEAVFYRTPEYTVRPKDE
jgi:transcriptional regulator with XRE-family HTH domain